MERQLALIALCTFIQFGHFSAQQPSDKPKELEALHEYVGNWASDVTNKPAIWDRNGTQFKTANHAEMILDGWFLLNIEVNHIVGEPDKVTKSLFIWTFDPITRKYVAWPFQSTGNTGPSTGEWNPTTKTFTTHAVEPPPNSTGKMTETFLDANTIKGNLTFIQGDGKTLMDMVWTRTRCPGDAAKATREQWEKIGAPIQALPVEMRQLEPFIGEWDSDFINGPSVQSPKGGTSKGKMTAKWILDGRFLFGTTEVGAHRSISVIGYDTTKRAYRNVLFSNTGRIDESVGQWNDDTRSFAWKAVNEQPEIVRTSTTRFIGRDAVQTQILSEDKTGKIVQDLTIRSSRSK